MKFRNWMCLLLILSAMLLGGCKKETRTVHCDRCGEEIALDADSNITEDWIVFCKTCELEAFGESGVVSGD